MYNIYKKVIDFRLITMYNYIILFHTRKGTVTIL